MEATPTKGNKMKLQATILMNDTIFGRDGKVIGADHDMDSIERQAHFHGGASSAFSARSDAFKDITTQDWGDDKFLCAGAFEYDVDPEDMEAEIREILKDCYMAYGNNYEGRKPEGCEGIRSMSIGDVILIGETAWACASFGWDKISGLNPENIKRHPAYQGI